MNSISTLDLMMGRAAVVSRNHGQRRGLALLTAIVALVVSAVIVVGILRSAATQFLEVRDQQRHLQAEELLDGGIGRALARLRKSSDYQGETWHVETDELGGNRTAQVEIKVASDADDTSVKRVSIQASYPPDEFNRVQISREIKVNFSSAGTTP